MILGTNQHLEIEEVFRPPTANRRYSAEDRDATSREVRGPAESLRACLQPSVIATVSTSFAMFGLTTVQGIVLARLLGPEARGEYGTVIFYTQTLTYVGMMGAQFAVARRAATEPCRRLELSRSVIRFGALTGANTMFVVAALAFTTLPPEKQSLAPLCVVCALALPAEQIRLLLLSVDQGRGAFRRYNMVQMATRSVFPVLLLALWVQGGVSVVAVALLTLVAPVVGLAMQLAMNDVGPLLTGEASPPARTLLKEGCPYLLSGAVSDLYDRLDTFLFLWLASFTALGFYAAAVPAASLLVVGPDALALFSFNAGSRRDAPLTLNRLVYGGLLVAALQVLMVSLLALVIGPLILLVYGGSFAGAVPFALALLPAHAAAGFAKVAEGHLRGRGNVNVGIQARLAAAVVMITTVLLTFSRLRELSIPLAASLAHGLVAVTLAWSAVADVRSQGEATTLLEIEEALP